MESWRAAATASGLLDLHDTHVGVVPNHRCGVSLSWLELFSSSLAGMGDGYESTQDLVPKLIVPTASMHGSKGRFWDLIPSMYKGEPDWYISHIWKTSFSDMVNRLDPLLAPSCQSLGAHWKDKVMFWIDIFSLKSQCLKTVSLASSSAKTELEELEATIQSCKKGLIVISDSGLQLPNNMWHLYEAWLAISPSYNVSRLKIALPDSATQTYVIKHLVLFDTFDISLKAIAKQTDKAKILAKVKQSPGLKKFNNAVAEAWQCAINCSLRWSPRARNRYLHCAMLLQCNDFGQLQAIMRTFPELHDDDADVRRITDTFKLSANPAGLMDESMCEAMLASFGLDMESAMQISNGLHFDENGNIGFEALKSWYLGIQRMLRQNTWHVHLNVADLQKNIALMARLLDRLGEWVMADIFRQHDITFNTGARLGDPAAQLPAPHARGGDWGPALELAAEKALDGDLYGANKTLLKMVSVLADVIDTHPDEWLPLPHDTPDNWELQYQVFRQYSDILLRLLSRMGPSKQKLCELLVNVIPKVKKEHRIQGSSVALGAPFSPVPNRPKSLNIPGVRGPTEGGLASEDFPGSPNISVRASPRPVDGFTSPRAPPGPNPPAGSNFSRGTSFRGSGSSPVVGACGGGGESSDSEAEHGSNYRSLMQKSSDAGDSKGHSSLKSAGVARKIGDKVRKSHLLQDPCASSLPPLMSGLSSDDEFDGFKKNNSLLAPLSAQSPASSEKAMAGSPARSLPRSAKGGKNQNHRVQPRINSRGRNKSPANSSDTEDDFSLIRSSASTPVLGQRPPGRGGRGGRDVSPGSGQDRSTPGRPTSTSQRRSTSPAANQWAQGMDAASQAREITPDKHRPSQNGDHCSGSSRPGTPAAPVVGSPANAGLRGSGSSWQEKPISPVVGGPASAGLRRLRCTMSFGIQQSGGLELAQRTGSIPLMALESSMSRIPLLPQMSGPSAPNMAVPANPNPRHAAGGNSSADPSAATSKAAAERQNLLQRIARRCQQL